MAKSTGHCLCEGVRFTIDGDIGPAGYCHCEDCRRMTGSAFNISSPVALAGFALVSGKLGSFTKLGDRGNELTRYFCLDCGSPIYTSAPKHAETIYVKCGVLDDPLLVQPVLEAWRDSKVTWAEIPQTVITYPKGRS